MGSSDGEGYDDEKFDEEPQSDPVNKSEERPEEEEVDEEYSDDDSEKQFEELKAQIYGDPDDDDYDQEQFEEEAEKPESSTPQAQATPEKKEAERAKEAPIVPWLDLNPPVKENKQPAKAPTKPPEKKKEEKKEEKKVVKESKPPEKKVDEITQNYLMLLKTGKLTSANVEDDEQQQPPPSRGASAEGREREGDRPQSVHEADLRRLEEGSEMEYAPLLLRSQGANEDARSPKDGTSSRSKATLATTAHNKILSPGPGQYSSSRDRFGRLSVVFDQERPATAACLGFGTSHRPEHFLVNKDGSPGPVHLPRSAFDSTKQGPKNFSLGRRIEEYVPSNHSKWNPSPLEYPEAAAMSADGRFVNSRGTLIHAFSKGKKLCTSAENLGRMVYIDEDHSRIDNSGVFSPSKIYDQDGMDAVRPASPCFTMGPKFKWGGCFYTTGRSLTPGPTYLRSSEGDMVNRRGLQTFGSGPRASIGNAPKDFSPERSLNQSPYISKDHCHKSNQLLFSAPVGLYSIPGMESERVKSPVLGSGPADRFYDRLEPGRLG